jgi:hypothetical protein
VDFEFFYFIVESAPLSSFFALKVVEWVKTLEGGIL